MCRAALGQKIFARADHHDILEKIMVICACKCFLTKRGAANAFSPRRHASSPADRVPPSSEPDWCTQVRYGSVTNTGNVTDDCFSSPSPICSLTDVLLYSHIHEISEVQNGRNIGLGNRLLKIRAGFLAGFVDDKGQSHADFVGLFVSFGPWITASDSY